MRAAVLLCGIVCLGCTTQALDRRTIELAESASDVRYREVVENLAMIANNRWTLPSYSTIYAGTADLSDTESVTTPLVPYVSSGLKPLFAGTLDFSATRAVKENWTLDPVVVPEKLLAMRCACWCVLDRCLYRDCGHGVFLGNYQDVPLDRAPPGYYFDVMDNLKRSLQTDWLRKGRARSALYSASCNNAEVYVTAEGMDGLTNFSAALNEIARVDFGSLYWPKPVTRTIKITHSSAADKCPNLPQGGAMPLQSEGAPATPKMNSISITVDEHGWLTTAPNKYSMANPNQPKSRKDNVGLDSNLRSQIANAKSP